MKQDVDEYLSSLQSSTKFGPQVVIHKKLEKVDSVLSKHPPSLSPHLLDGLKTQGITKLFTHQTQAINKILSGQDVIVSTPTASGKSMIYNLPVLNELYADKKTYSLYLFPLKALAQDQRNKLTSLFQLLPGKTLPTESGFSALYDGDTNSYQRRKIRDNPPSVLFSNPEMLHLSFLPYHQNWQHFFGALKYVVIDEVHSYRGVLGSHMAWVIQRLQRIAKHYGANPQFILLSATVGNPESLGRNLIGRDISVISESGAPQSEKNVVFLNPWDSAAYTAGQLLEAAVKRQLRTIVYTQSRKMTELIHLWTSPRLGALADKLSAYRAGFLPEERREIEARLFSGDLYGVISTSALELGIDIGDLDLCILVGYPGSIMSTWQRGGRVGRSMRKSAIILVAQEDALDQYFMRQPEDFFSRNPEDAVLNPRNPNIVDKHLICCAAELPITADEVLFDKNLAFKRIEHLVAKGKLLITVAGETWVSPRKYPQREVTLRGGGLQMSIIDGSSGEIIGEIDKGRALKECHPGAVYLHRARMWLVSNLDLLANEVLVKEERPNYFTRPTSEKQTEILEIVDCKTSHGVEVFFGKLKVRERVTGYQKKNIHTHKLISTTPLDLPEQIIETEGVWFNIPRDIVAKTEGEKLHFMGAIHAIEHAMIALFPLLVLCDRNDIGGISCPLHEQTENASVFVYDGHPGGIGLAFSAYNKIDKLFIQTAKTVSSCNCETGCPSCVHSPKCGSGNRPIDKTACLFLLQAIIDSHATPVTVSNTGNDILKTKTQAGKINAGIIKTYPKGLSGLPGRFGVFDLETIRSAEEVGGWGRADKMGMSLGVVYDGSLQEYFTYMEDEVDSLVTHLKSLELVVGFNNKRFDNRVLSGYGHSTLHNLPTLDLLEEIHNYLGYRLSLNGLAEQTLSVAKSADGLQALQWYKEGKIELIRKYCQKDVEITTNLLLYCLENGHLLFKNKAKQVVRLPLKLDKAIAQIIGRASSEKG